MKRFIVTVAAMIATASSALAQDYSDFFSFNGSFETSVSDPLRHYTNYWTNPSHVQNWSSDLTGWRLFGENTFPSWLTGNAQDGTHYLAMNEIYTSVTTDSLASIDGSQISSTPFAVGDPYELSFWAAGGTGSSNALSVGIDWVGAIIDLPEVSSQELAQNGPAWSLYTIAFVPTSPTISLSVSPARDPNHFGYASSVFVDNFSITHVPEPGSAVLASLGGGLLFVARRRRGQGQAHQS